MRTLPLLLVAACAPTTSTAPATGTTGTSGTTPARVEDDIVRTLASTADVLFVVQATPGSSLTQARLAQELPALVDTLVGSGVDYHLGVVSSDLDGATPGQLVSADGQRWLDADTPNPAAVFGTMAALGEGAPGSEPMGATYLAIGQERELSNAGFFRADAQLTTIVVGDGTDATDPALIDAAGFEAWYPTLEPSPDQGTFSCVLTPGAGTACGDLAAQLGGVVSDLDARGLDPVAPLTVGVHDPELYPLSQIPLPDTLEVEVEEVTGATLAFTDTDWTWDPATNAVSFVEYVPTPLSTVKIRYVPAP